VRFSEKQVNDTVFTRGYHPVIYDDPPKVEEKPKVVQANVTEAKNETVMESFEMDNSETNSLRSVIYAEDLSEVRKDEQLADKISLNSSSVLLKSVPIVERSKTTYVQRDETQSANEADMKGADLVAERHGSKEDGARENRG